MFACGPVTVASAAKSQQVFHLGLMRQGHPKIRHEKLKRYNRPTAKRLQISADVVSVAGTL